MTCPPHDFAPRPFKEIQHLGYLERQHFSGQACRDCNKLRGRDTGIIQIDFEQSNGTHGHLPEWLLRALNGATYAPQGARGAEILDEVLDLVTAGKVDARIKYNSGQGRLVVNRVWAPHAGASALGSMRQHLAESVPAAAKWIASASLRDLETAQRITNLPNWLAIQWPPRTWNAMVNGHSKSGNASDIAARLGCTIARRASPHAAWFYGQGTIHTTQGSYVVNGEMVLPSALCEPTMRFDASHMMIVENRDVAASMPGFIMALDGQPTDHNHSVIEAAVTQGLDVSLWTDFDGAGVSIMGQILAKFPSVKLIGLAAWPSAWSQSLDGDDGRRLQVLDAQATYPQFDAVCRHILANGWVKQERIFGEGTLRQLGIKELAALNTPFQLDSGEAAARSTIRRA